MSAIVDIVGREILDSRGNPTVECDVLLESPAPWAAPPCPRGASTGSREAIELRDGDKSRYLGKGVLQGGRAHQHRDLRGRARPGRVASRPSSTSTLIDLDGTENKSRLGANAMLAVSHGGGARRGRGVRPAAVPLLRRHGRACSCRCR